MSIGSAQQLVPHNPSLCIFLSLEAKKRLANAIAAHDRYVKSGMVDLRDNGVSSYAGQ